MSGVLLICILPAGEPPGTESAPLAGPPLEGLIFRSLTLWLRPAPHAPAATLAEVRAHHRLVEGAWTARPAVLPVRFGQWFATSAALTAALEERADDYAAALERVRGAAEYSVRILDPGAGPDPAAPEPAPSGTAYLRAAAERERRRSAAEARGREVAVAMKTALAEFVREERVDPLPSPHGLVAVSHLVDRARGRAYESAADGFAAARPELGFLRTGPWPAWSFTA